MHMRVLILGRYNSKQTETLPCVEDNWWEKVNEEQLSVEYENFFLCARIV